MKKRIMIKTICAIIAVTVVALACSKDIIIDRLSNGTIIQPKFDKNGYWNTPNFRFKISPDGKQLSYYGTTSLYGTYLAARLAHLRHDFENAAEYYKIVLEKDEKNETVNRYTYVILASNGDIESAVKYAKNEPKYGKTNFIAPLIVAIKNFEDYKYNEAIKEFQLMEGENLHKNLISPLLKAWAYAGLNDEVSAIKSIDEISDDPSIETLKYIHKGMIYDFFGNKTEADNQFSYILKNKKQDVTFRILEIITDFYVRNGNKELAKQISSSYHDNSLLTVLLSNIDKQIDTKNTESKAIIDTPQKGLAEALFNIGTIFRFSSIPEFAQIYIALSSHMNPEYDVSKIALANILEENGFLNEAAKYYAQINKESGSYFIARIKMIEIYNTLENREKAEDYLRKLIKENPNNSQLLSNLGDILRSMNKYPEAIKIYKKAIENLQNENGNSWPIFYSLGVTYHRNNQMNLAEENLQKAIKLSNKNPHVLNYLGYTWLEAGKNPNDAINMIIEAYQKMPYDGNIVDSIGWACYRLGLYDKAILYLEQASDMLPSNALISDHLGDAYWFGGRKNEAIFQWKHALTLKEGAEEIKRDVIENKIENSLIENKILNVDNHEIVKKLLELDSGNNSAKPTKKNAAK